MASDRSLPRGVRHANVQPTTSTHLHSVDLFVVGDGLGHRSEAQLLREGALRLLLLLPAAADGPPDGRVVEETLEPAALPRRRAVINEVFFKIVHN